MSQLGPQMPSEVRPGLLLGSYAHAASFEVFDALGITHVVNAASEHGDPQAQRAAILRAPLHDRPGARVVPTLRAAAEFIAVARQAGGRVLVHCHQGISRGATVAVAALMVDEGLSCAAALAAVQAARPQVDPSPRLLAALEQLEEELAGS